MYQPDLEKISRKDLKALQLQRLQKTIRHAWRNVPAVRNRFENAGVKPADLKSLKDLAKFPFARKSDLRDNYPFGLFAVPQEKLVRVHGSSGTTGKPTIVGYSKKDMKTWSSLMARSLVAAGVKPGDVMQNSNGYGLFTGGLGFHGGAEELGCTVVPLSGGNTDRQIMMLVDMQADVLISTPSYALNIADVAESQGIDLKNAPVRVALCGAEAATDALRAEAGRRLGLTMIDHYGLSEVMGPGVAAECLEAATDPDSPGGLHLWEDHFLFEIIDPKTGEVLPDGESGELVITTLTKEALPMVRYRTGDITHIMKEKCICGRSHRRMARAKGRSDDMLVIRGVNVYPSVVEEALIGLPGVAPHYQLVVRDGKSMAMVDVEVEALPSIKKSDYPKLTRRISERLKQATGVSFKVIVCEPGKLPRSEGKAVRIRDLRKA
jgi:phenylacetate-CoA ligase